MKPSQIRKYRGKLYHNGQECKENDYVINPYGVIGKIVGINWKEEHGIFYAASKSMVDGNVSNWYASSLQKITEEEAFLHMIEE